MDSMDDGLDLESAFEELEQIVQVLEEGNLSLEESLEVFERGISLVRVCNASLDRAEQRIECLTGGLPSDIND